MRPEQLPDKTGRIQYRGQSAGNTLFLDGGSKGNWADIAFFDQNQTPIPYWQETGTSNTTFARYWVNVSNIPCGTANKTLFYIAFNNTTLAAYSANPYSSGTMTFPVFDDFNDGSITGWTADIPSGSGSIAESGGTLNINVNTYHDWWSTRTCPIFKLNLMPPGNWEATITLKNTAFGTQTLAGLGMYGTDSGSRFINRVNYPEGEINGYAIQKPGSENGATANIITTTLPAVYKMRRTDTNALTFFYSMDSGVTWNQLGITYSDITNNNIFLIAKTWSGNALTASFDDFFVRNYTNNPPQVSIYTPPVPMANISWYDNIKKLYVNGSVDCQLQYYQVCLSIYNTIGNNSGNRVFLNGMSQGNWADIAFFDLNQKLIPFWLENGTSNNTYARFWVNVSNIPQGMSNSVLFYIAWNNTTLAQQTSNPYSNGVATFPFFDDFKGSSLDTSKWNVNAGNPVVNNGILDLTGSNCKVSSKATYGQNTRLLARTYPKSSQCYVFYYQDDTHCIAFRNWITGSNDILDASIAFTNPTVLQNPATHAYQTFEIARGGNSYVSWRISDNEVKKAYTNNLDIIPISFSTFSSTSAENIIDWAAITNFTAHEPQIWTEPQQLLPANISMYGNIKKMYLNGSSDYPLNNYQVNLSVYNLPGLDYSNVIFLSGLSKGNWSDVAFFDLNQKLIPFWLENGTSNNTYARFWVNISSISQGMSNSVLFYIAWNNTTLAQQTSNPYSNGVATFPFFDDFKGSSLDTSKWNVNAGNPTVSSGILDLTGSNCKVSSKATYGQNTRLLARAYPKSSQCYVFYYQDDTHCIAFRNWITGSNDILDASIAFTNPTLIQNPCSHAYQTFEIARGGNSYVSWRIDNSEVKRTSVNNVDVIPISFSTFSSTSAENIIDWAAITNFTAHEPQIWTEPPRAAYETDSIPVNMSACQSYNVSITMNNTGISPWLNESKIMLGTVGDLNGTAARFSSTRIGIPSGVVVQPGQNHTFNFTMTPPTIPGVYNISYRMVWDNVTWFGDYVNETVTVDAIPNASFGNDTIPDSIPARDPYNVSITVNNTGTMSWNSDLGVVLAVVDDPTNNASMFSNSSINITRGVTVEPGHGYTFNFTFTPPLVPGTYNLSYRMLWPGHGGFGDTFNQPITVYTVPNARLDGETIPPMMNINESYNVTITLNNTGTMPWSDLDQIRLGAIGDLSGDAAKFTNIRFYIPPGVIVQPGESYTFNFTMIAPTTDGRYYPSFRMVWENHTWFGDYINKSIFIPHYDSEITNNIIPLFPSTIYPNEWSAGYYFREISILNSGTGTWPSNNVILQSVSGGQYPPLNIISCSINGMNDVSPGNYGSYTVTIPVYNVQPGVHTLKIQLSIGGKPFGQIYTQNINIMSWDATPTPTPVPLLPDLSISSGDIAFQKVG